MDVIDRAQLLDDMARQDAIRTAVRAQPPTPGPTGYCLHCEDPVESGRRWCCRECAAAWEREHKKGTRRA